MDDAFFDFEGSCDEQPELAADGPAATMLSYAKLSVLTQICARLQHLSTPCNEFGRKVMETVSCAISRKRSAPGTLATDLAASGFDVIIRRARSESTTGAGIFRSLRHEFLMVRGTVGFRGMEFIVEPSLRQHFAIPHPSPDYDYVLSRTPDVFVGGSCRLVPVVQLLSALIADSFSRQGLALPPWRREAAMLSKWLPQPHLCTDIVLRSTTAAPPSHVPAADVQLHDIAIGTTWRIPGELQLCTGLTGPSNSGCSRSSSIRSQSSDTGSSHSDGVDGSSGSSSSSSTSSGSSVGSSPASRDRYFCGSPDPVSLGRTCGSGEEASTDARADVHRTAKDDITKEGGCSRGSSYCPVWSRAVSSKPDTRCILPPGRITRGFNVGPGETISELLSYAGPGDARQTPSAKRICTGAHSAASGAQYGSRAAGAASPSDVSSGTMAVALTSCSVGTVPGGVQFAVAAAATLNPAAAAIAPTAAATTLTPAAATAAAAKPLAATAAAAAIATGPCLSEARSWLGRSELTAQLQGRQQASCGLAPADCPGTRDGGNMSHPLDASPGPSKAAAPDANTLSYNPYSLVLAA